MFQDSVAACSSRRSCYLLSYRCQLVCNDEVFIRLFLKDHFMVNLLCISVCLLQICLIFLRVQTHFGAVHLDLLSLHLEICRFIPHQLQHFVICYLIDFSLFILIRYFHRSSINNLTVVLIIVDYLIYFCYLLNFYQKLLFVLFFSVMVDHSMQGFFLYLYLIFPYF